MKKKILYIHHGIGIGGAPLSLLYLIQNLDKKKYHPVVLFLQDSEVIDLYKSKNIEVYGSLNLSDFSHTKVWWYRWYHPHHLFRAVWDSFKTIFGIADKWLTKIKPDIVHLNTSSLIAWGKVASKKNILVIFHVREPLADGYLGIRKWIIKRCVEKYASKILPICKNDAKPWLGNSKVNVVYNAVDPKLFDISLFNNNNLDPSFGKLKILFLGGLSKEKGTLLILKVFELLIKEFSNVELLIAGYFDNSVVSKFSLKYYLPSQIYKREVNAVLLNIKDKIKFLGPIKNVPEMMATCDIVVFPATVGHFARPIIEAGFMKKVVVASNLQPLDELVINEKTGFLVDPKDLNVWKNVLKKLLNDGNLRNFMGDNAYKFCVENFSIQNQVDKIQDIYKSF